MMAAEVSTGNKDLARVLNIPVQVAVFDQTEAHCDPVTKLRVVSVQGLYELQGSESDRHCENDTGSKITWSVQGRNDKRRGVWSMTSRFWSLQAKTTSTDLFPGPSSSEWRAGRRHAPIELFRSVWPPLLDD